MAEKVLSPTEMKVIGLLDINARSRFRQIARTVRKSEQNVSYTVNSLMKKGVIKGFQTLVDYSRLSVLNFRVYFSINYISEERFETFKNFLINDPHSLWVVSCGSRYDVLCTFAFRNPSQFNKHLRSIMSRFAHQINSYSVLTTIVIRSMNRKYMLGRCRKCSVRIIGGDREAYDLPQKDIALLAAIADDARKGSVELARSLSCDPRTVMKRIKELQDMEVIKGFRVLLDTKRTSLVKNILLVRYHNISVEDEQTLISYLDVHPNVVCVTKTLGEWDLEISIEAESVSQFRQIERRIRSKFPAIIHTAETVPIYSEHKMTFFPRFLAANGRQGKYLYV